MRQRSLQMWSDKGLSCLIYTKQTDDRDPQTRLEVDRRPQGCPSLRDRERYWLIQRGLVFTAE